MVGFVTIQANTALATPNAESIETVQDDSDLAIVQDAVVAEASATIEVDNWYSKALNFILGIVGITFAGLFAKVRLKLKQVAELGLKLYEYSSDNNFSKAEIQDIVTRIFKILGKESPKFTQTE